MSWLTQSVSQGMHRQRCCLTLSIFPSPAPPIPTTLFFLPNRHTPYLLSYFTLHHSTITLHPHPTQPNLTLFHPTSPITPHPTIPHPDPPHPHHHHHPSSRRTSTPPYLTPSHHNPPHHTLLFHTTAPHVAEHAGAG